ncbi:D-hexose-6-phosphate mutarotase [Thiomicrospira cyclica]|uniref:Putative glucose-6-phosphate 1-epimerase n=1 Tax=Thiomicrospira cyclica (strain DSM 14477 / JCM 11371 / ALM1) TaxID=717773 RepID=F6D924_THICA|nr:D-hexose-6-phosphate mutarotase [Thiomicrospira cyclica]AEG30855.1 Aldose 1-epimerase [Thiomicrospira cyclica ALM1]
MLDQLQQRFDHPNVRFYQRDQLVMIELNNRYGQATVTTHGATLLSYIPAGGSDLLWVSDTAIYDGSKPVRGGVPVCWPWFGAYDASKMGADPTDAVKKAHGFARYELWEVESVESIGDATQVVLSLTPNASIEKAWSHDFKLSLAITLGKQLTVELIGENRSDQAWYVTEALHTYFKVAQAPGLVVEGLEGITYYDKNQDFAPFTQTDRLKVQAPMDCVYVDHIGAVVIKDQGRDIKMDKSNSASTIVWNPGAEGVKAFADMPDGQYQHMVCIEAGNALQNGYELAAGARHVMTMTLEEVAR